MKILVMRYDHDNVPGCGATAACNGIRNMYLTSHRGLKTVHGRDHLEEEDEVDENVDVSRIIITWVNAGYIGGDSGSFIARRLHDYNMGQDREIREGEPIYSVIEYGQRQRLLNFLRGPNANTYGIIRGFVAELEIQPNASFVSATPHFISIFRIASNENHVITHGNEEDDTVDWFICGGEKGSHVLRIKHRNLLDLLFTNTGRLLLEDCLSGPWGQNGRVTFVNPGRMGDPTILFAGTPALAQFDPNGDAIVPESSYIILPKIQLMERDIVSEDETVGGLGNSLPWPVSANSGRNARKMHAIQVINGVNVGQPHPLIRDLDSDLEAVRENNEN
jgi:hypothetical protein